MQAVRKEMFPDGAWQKKIGRRQQCLRPDDW
jgi:hypothetical protein